MLSHAAAVFAQRSAQYGEPRTFFEACKTLVADARANCHTGGGRAVHDRSRARAACAQSEAPGLDRGHRGLRRRAARGRAMRWAPRGYGGARRAPEEVKRDGWREQNILVVAANDDRLTWPERELVRQLGEKLYGPKGARHG